MNASSWPMFLLRTLNGAEMAPGTAFKKVIYVLQKILAKHLVSLEAEALRSTHPLQEPPRPSQNNFKPGMKLEAVDKKNPYLICPATIGEVKGDEVFIMFDGWRGAFDYWCKFDSRDIFPVGWCSLTKHSLQPPGNSGTFTPLGGSTCTLRCPGDVFVEEQRALQRTLERHIQNACDITHVATAISCCVMLDSSCLKRHFTET